MGSIDVNVPWQYRQRGAAARPRTWLVIALFLVGVASAALNVYQYAHPRVLIYLMHPESGTPQPEVSTVPPEPQKEKADSGALDTDGSCDLSWSYCWKTT
jgi:hypothetical protein